MPKAKDPIQRFTNFLSIQVNGCWAWMGSRGPDGYGRFRMESTRGPLLAHRWLWEKCKGPVPKGLDLDHLCRNRWCVNPDHLEPVTRLENIRRGDGPTLQRKRFAEKTHCKWGHPWKYWNIYTNPNTGLRCCKICKNVKNKVMSER